jgi:DNA-binding NarL/FixJ family response regulator
MGVPRVLLAEDNPMMAKALEGIVERHFDLVATVGDGCALVEAASRLQPDVIVADVSMPLLSGIDATRELTKTGSPSKIILLTMHADLPIAKEAFRSGASGYLIKLSAARELPTAIREVMLGKTYVTPLISDNPDSLIKEAEN